MGYRDYGSTLKTLNHYQSSDSDKIEFFDIDKPRNLYGIKSNNIKYYLHPYQEIIDYDKNLPNETIDWANKLKKNGVKLYILSNSNKKEKVRTVLPKMGFGAIAGAAGGMLLGGPFGLATNAIIGASLGFASDTEKFKDALFGVKDEDGNRQGGILGEINEIILD